MEIHPAARKHGVADEVLAAAAGRLMMGGKGTRYGRTASGKTITDELVDELASKADHGYDVDDTLRRRAGRPPLGTGPASVELARLEPELRDALRARAEREHETTSSIIRKALREYLKIG